MAYISGDSIGGIKTVSKYRQTTMKLCLKISIAFCKNN